MCSDLPDGFAVVLDFFVSSAVPDSDDPPADSVFIALSQSASFSSSRLRLARFVVYDMEGAT